jgi:DNA-binding CsgD family transcriptional regulator
MHRLEAREERRIGRLVLETAAIDPADVPFPGPFLSALRRLVPCDSVAFSELDRVRERQLAHLEDPPWDGSEPEVTYWEIRHEHPTCRRDETTGDFRARRISEFSTMRALRRTRIYAQWFRPQDVDDQLTVGLDAPLRHTKVFLFTHGPGHAFDDRDCVVLEALRPYLASRYALWEATHRAEQTGSAEGSLGGLTVRERQVIALVADGLTNAEVAECLWISPGTVRRHLENVYGKLDVHTRTAAVRAYGRLR